MTEKETVYAAVTWTTSDEVEVQAGEPVEVDADDVADLVARGLVTRDLPQAQPQQGDGDSTSKADQHHARTRHKE